MRLTEEEIVFETSLSFILKYGGVIENGIQDF